MKSKLGLFYIGTITPINFPIILLPLGFLWG